MFMQNSAEELSRPTGIQRARPASGRKPELHDEAKRQCCSIEFLVALLLIGTSVSLTTVELSTYLQNSHGVFGGTSKLLSTVHTLYAGPLVGNQTTAPRCQSPVPVLLAALFVVLATLTIAARCYASTTNISTTTTQSLVQFHHPDTSISPIFIKYSNPTSSIVLSRSFPNPLKYDVQSDTSVIEADSNSKLREKRRAFRRRKREFDRTKPTGYSNYLQRPTRPTPDHKQKNDLIQIPYVQVLPTFKYSVDFERNGSKGPEGDQARNFTVHGSEGGGGVRDDNSVNYSRVASTFVVDKTYDQAIDSVPANKRPMPSAHDHNKSSLSENGVLVLVVAVVVLTVALGLVTCVVSHYRGGTAANPHDAAHTPTTAPMLSVVSAGATAGVGGMDRLRGRGAGRDLTAASRDRQVRLHAVHTDIAINLPPSIPLPDGEEHPFTSRIHIRDTEQESEIYQKCIRPPPNRTVLESESPPPYRSSSAGLLGSTGGGSSSGSSDWSSGGGGAPLVVRCHSMSSSTSKRPDGGPSGQKTDFIQKTVKIFTGKKSQQQQAPSPAPTLPTLTSLPPPPVVIVPSRTRRTPTEQQNTIATTTSSSTTTTTTATTTGRPKPNV